MNVQNVKDEKCFIWAVLAALYNISTNPERVSTYPINHDELFNLSNIQFPTPICQISKFEKQNDISVNVYGLEFNEKLKTHVVVGPLHYTKCKKDKHINLLYFKNEDHAHYAWIKSLSRLLYDQISKRKTKKYICDRCLQYFGRLDILDLHIKDCELNDAVKIEMPNDQQKWLKFENYNHKERHPFVVYADFECLTTPIETCQPNIDTSYTTAYQHHIPCAIGYQVVCSYDDSLSYYNSYCGPEASKWFMNELRKIADNVQIKHKNILPVQMTSEDYINFDKTNVCHICETTFDNGNCSKVKVKDHCHLTGKYRGAAHQKCNLKYQNQKFIPVFFHNFTGYDSHLLVKEFSGLTGEINVIPTSEEKFISISITLNKMKIRFLDTYRFMQSSLEKLVSYMHPELFTLMHTHYTDNEERKLLMRKGVFPYDFMSNWECLQETQLPPDTMFYSKLTNKHISKEDYIHAQRVWNIFKIKNFGEYMELYLKTDVLLLADVFENFRNICLNSYRLDPVYYYTTPGN